MADRDGSVNPSEDQRHQMLLESLTRAGRADDYENILELLAPPPDLPQTITPGSLKNIRIGIIGGGLAGLAAAYELRKLGADITIYEAKKDRVGGRVYTFYFDRSGKYFGEFGPARIPVSHETTWHYIDLFHLDTESLSSPQANNFIYAHKTRIRREAGGRNVTEYLYPHYDLTENERNTPWNVLSSYATDTMLNQLSPEQRRDILKIQREYDSQYAAITRMSNRQIFEMLGLSQGAISLLSAVDPFAGALLNVSHDETMNTGYTLDFLNTYRITGGMIHLPLAFYNSLSDDDPPEIQFPSYFLGKVSIRLGQPVNGIFQAREGKGVELRFRNLWGSERNEIYDYVICAIPLSTLREVDIQPFFRNQKMQAIKEYNYIDAQKTLFLCKKRFWEENQEYGNMNGGISFTDLPIQSIVYPSDHLRCGSGESCSPEEPGVLTASYNLVQDSVRVSGQTAPDRIDLIRRNVQEVHGLPAGYLDSVIDTYKTVDWNMENWSRGAFSAGIPGQKLIFAYELQQPEYDGRLYFAGEHASAKQGWIQGALYSGKAAANKLAASYLRL